MKIKLLQWLLIIFLLPADGFFLFGKQRVAIHEDLNRLQKELPYEKMGLAAFNYAMVIHKPFRNIFYYRIQYSILWKNISRLFFKPLATIEIMGDIAPGMRISHNYAVIHPRKAGRNFSVGHGTTIGKGKANACGEIYPTIGDNVTIFAGAIVFGGIAIGNNVKIGAGAVVHADVPDEATVVGNPARIILASDRCGKEEAENGSTER